jgi:hypothetical protein
VWMACLTFRTAPRLISRLTFARPRVSVSRALEDAGCFMIVILTTMRMTEETAPKRMYSLCRALSLAYTGAATPKSNGN